VCAGQVPVRYARHVAQQTRDLAADAAGLVDAAVAEYADGRLGWSRFETLVAATVVEADPQAAADAERAAAEDEFAKVGRSNQHGQKTLYVRSAAGVSDGLCKRTALDPGPTGAEGSTHVCHGAAAVVA
jgi:hypothetical protein